MNKNKILEKVFITVFIIGISLAYISLLTRYIPDLSYYINVLNTQNQSSWGANVDKTVTKLISYIVIASILFAVYVVCAILSFFNLWQKWKLTNIMHTSLLFLTLIMIIFGSLSNILPNCTLTTITRNNLNEVISNETVIIWENVRSAILLFIALTSFVATYVFYLIKEIKQLKADKQSPDTTRPN